MSFEISRPMAAAYDRVAGEFARRNAVMPPDLLDVGPRFLAQVGPAASILDVGCGAGRDLAWLREQGAAVVGVDLSLHRYAGAGQRARSRAPLAS